MSEKFGPVSLSELTFVVTRAVFGAGCPMGVAEDTATVAVAMAKLKDDPTSVIASALDHIVLGVVSTSLTANMEDGLLAFDSGCEKSVSAIFAGIAVHDHLFMIKADKQKRIIIKNVDYPDLAAAFIRHLDSSFKGLHILISDQDDLLISFTEGDGSQVNKSLAINDHHNLLVSLSGWSGILKHFKNSLVPDTEASRLSGAGAGAGLVDTD